MGPASRLPCCHGPGSVQGEINDTFAIISAIDSSKGRPALAQSAARDRPDRATGGDEYGVLSRRRLGHGSRVKPPAAG